MANLFSMFDPVGVGGFSNLWATLILVPAGISGMPASMKSGVICSLRWLFAALKAEVDPFLGPGLKSATSSLWVTIFMLIVSLNIVGLLPCTFSITAFLAFPLLLSLTMWLGPVVSSFVENPQGWAAHFVPVSTPGPLLIPMVLIETVSLVIRPVTLAVRLMANIMAGHLLMSLVGASFTTLSGAWMSFLAQTSLCVLEMAVAVLQGYVFMVLLVLYSSEG